MSVRSSTFGGFRLSNEDAAKFRKAMDAPAHDEAAAASLARGREMVKRARAEDGRITIEIKRRA